MEKNIKIAIGDKKYIYGTLRGSLKNPLIILVHGLGGFKDEHLHFNGSRFFERNGFAALRFNLYGYEKDARKLVDCSLSVHARDLDTVVRYFRQKKVKHISVIGHSYGGPTVISSMHKDFNKIVLWDPALDPADFIKKEVKKLEGTDVFYVEWGLSIILGKMMVEEDKHINSVKLLKSTHIPIKFIYAGKGQLKNTAKKYFNTANKPKEFTVIEGASHNFNEEGMEEKLFKETVKWIRNNSYSD